MSGFARVSCAEAWRRMQEGWPYLDVRSVEEFVGGHPLGAINVPWRLRDERGNGVENPDFLRVVHALLADLQAPAILGCAAGSRSVAAAEALANVGYTQLAVMDAGYDGLRGLFGELEQPGWRAEGLPVSTDPRPAQTWAELAKT